jgi:hypothetical protein
LKKKICHYTRTGKDFSLVDVDHRVKKRKNKYQFGKLTVSEK